MSFNASREIVTSAFEDRSALHDDTTQAVLNKNFILPWLSALPRKNNLVLDLACGQGIESRVCESQGFRYIGQDTSRTLLSSSIHRDKVFGDVTALPFRDSQFSGVLIKDAMIFLPPEDREVMFTELKRILIPGGSVFISSQVGNRLRFHYLPKGSKIAQKESFENQYGWQEKLEMMKAEGQVFSIEFVTEPSGIQQLSSNLGFSIQLLHEYTWDDPLSRENRWIERNGFVMQLIKLNG